MTQPPFSAASPLLLLLPPRLLPPFPSTHLLAMTSLAFMLLWVPLPVCQMTRGKWSVSFPSATSVAAVTMAPPILLSRTPWDMLTCVHVGGMQGHGVSLCVEGRAVDRAGGQHQAEHSRRKVQWGVVSILRGCV
jgi:hypothetical protein